MQINKLSDPMFRAPAAENIVFSFLIDPALPYIFVPSDDFESLIKNIQTLFGQDNPKCDLNGGTIIFQSTCDKVQVLNK